MAREKGKGSREAKGTGNNSNRRQHRHCYIEKEIRNGIKLDRIQTLTHIAYMVKGVRKRG